MQFIGILLQKSIMLGLQIGLHFGIDLIEENRVGCVPDYGRIELRLGDAVFLKHLSVIDIERLVMAILQSCDLDERVSLM